MVGTLIATRGVAGQTVTTVVEVLLAIFRRGWGLREDSAVDCCESVL